MLVAPIHPKPGPPKLSLSLVPFLLILTRLPMPTNGGLCFRHHHLLLLLHQLQWLAAFDDGLFVSKSVI